ncbi:hypothetical protein B7486_53505, partial [cyanobacterium TDX16]
MCGIIAVLRRPTDRTPPDLDDVVDVLRTAAAGLPEVWAAIDAGTLDGVPARLDELAEQVEGVDRLLRGTPGCTALLGEPSGTARVLAEVANLGGGLAELERRLDAFAGTDTGTSTALEAVNAALIRLKDGWWAVERDRLRAAREVEELGGPDLGAAAIAGYLSIQQSLSAIDRLEVRGRDSAGLCVLVHGHTLDLADPAVAAAMAARAGDPLFQSGSVRAPNGHLAFVYKAAAEIGELGDNTAAIRRAIYEDDLLRQALASSPEAQVTVLGHTRWASVGIISQPNAHPVTSEEARRPDAPWLASVLNGDVDNFADLAAGAALEIAPEITTDAKVIPTLCSRHLGEGDDGLDAFRSTVARLEGSVAIGTLSADEPGTVSLAVRGSGQGVYVGVADDLYLVASEPYGVVEETATYLRLDGETPANPENPTASRGQIVRLAAADA